MSRRSLLDPVTLSASSLFSLPTLSILCEPHRCISARQPARHWHAPTSLLTADPQQLLASGCLSLCEPLDEIERSRQSLLEVGQSLLSVCAFESTLVNLSPVIEVASSGWAKECGLPRPPADTTRQLAHAYRWIAPDPNPVITHSSLRPPDQPRPRSWQRRRVTRAAMKSPHLQSLSRQLQWPLTTWEPTPRR